MKISNFLKKIFYRGRQIYLFDCETILHRDVSPNESLQHQVPFLSPWLFPTVSFHPLWWFPIMAFSDVTCSQTCFSHRDDSPAAAFLLPWWLTHCGVSTTVMIPPFLPQLWCPYYAVSCTVMPSNVPFLLSWWFPMSFLPRDDSTLCRFSHRDDLPTVSFLPPIWFPHCVVSPTMMMFQLCRFSHRDDSPTENVSFPQTVCFLPQLQNK